VNDGERHVLRESIAVGRRTRGPFGRAPEDHRDDVVRDRNVQTRSTTTRGNQNHPEDRAERKARSHELVQDRALHLFDELIYDERLSADVRGAQETRDLPAIGTAAYDHDRDVVGVRPALAPARHELARNRALYLPEELRQRNIQALSEVGKSRERRRHSPGLHLPHVLALEVDHALWARAELGHREPLLLTELADPFSHLAEEARLAGDVRVHPRRHTNSTISPSASSP